MSKSKNKKIACDILEELQSGNFEKVEDIIERTPFNINWHYGFLLRYLCKVSIKDLYLSPIQFLVKKNINVTSCDNEALKNSILNESFKTSDILFAKGSFFHVTPLCSRIINIGDEKIESFQYIMSFIDYEMKQLQENLLNKAIKSKREKFIEIILSNFPGIKIKNEMFENLDNNISSDEYIFKLLSSHSKNHKHMNSTVNYSFNRTLSVSKLKQMNIEEIL